MPRYDYRCTVCGQVYEQREGFDAPPVQACISCQGVARRVLTPPAIVFKGSGWYKTDSRGSEPSGASSTKQDTKTETTTESKSESKSEPAPPPSPTTSSEPAAAD